jgi:hypothetical protein
MSADLTGSWPVVGIEADLPPHVDQPAETALDIVTSLVWQVRDRTRERDEARARLEKVRAAHQRMEYPGTDGLYARDGAVIAEPVPAKTLCTCGRRWPCPTIDAAGETP